MLATLQKIIAQCGNGVETTFNTAQWIGPKPAHVACPGPGVRASGSPGFAFRVHGQYS